MSRECGSVRLRTGPGPGRAAARRAASCSAALALALALSSAAAAARTRVWLAAGCLTRRRSPVPVAAIFAAFCSCQSSILACCAAVTRSSFSCAAATRAAAPRAARGLASRGGVQVSAGPGVALSPGGLPLGFQPGQRRGDPVRPGPRVGQLGRHLIAADPRPEQGVLGRVGGGVLGGQAAASFRSASSVRFASIDADAFTFVPSSATMPSWPMPSRAHKARTCVNSSPAAAPSPARNRATVT